MASHRRVRSISSMILIFIILLTSFSCVASGSFFKNGYYPRPYSYSLDTFPELTPYSAPGIVVTDSDDGSYVAASPGTSINVSLLEMSPYQDWIPISFGSANYTGNDLQDSYPVRHIFRLLVNDSSAVGFKLIDERTGNTLKTFRFYVVANEPESGIGWPVFSADLVPSFVWPLSQKF